MSNLYLTTLHRCDGAFVVYATQDGELVAEIVCADGWVARIVCHVLGSDASGCVSDAERVARILNDEVGRERAAAISAPFKMLADAMIGGGPRP